MSEERHSHPHALPVVVEATGAPDGDVRPIPVVCRKLRTKMAFGTMHAGLRDWRHGDSTTAVYWCLVTMESAGPDDAYAHAHSCGRGRECFVPPAGEDDVA
jgi:hypothetical protein